MTKSEYQCIDCNLYDYIEHYATLKHPVSIRYKSNNTMVHVVQKILDTKINQKKEEFILLSTGAEIRMDHLSQIEDIQFIAS